MVCCFLAITATLSDDVAILKTHTNVGNRIVGGISAATSGAKAMHNASTAQEVHVITESVSHFAFRVSPHVIICSGAHCSRAQDQDNRDMLC